MNSKRKGKSGELEFSRLCRAQGYETHRTAQCRGDTGQAADVEGLPGIHIEVKRGKEIHIEAAYAQAVRDQTASDVYALPIVASRRDRCAWLITMNDNDFAKLALKYGLAKVTAIAESRKRFNLDDAVMRAKLAHPSRPVVLCYRKSGKEYRTMLSNDWFELYREWEASR